jgi:hypothetical protein
MCPATEPVEVPGNAVPVPALGSDADRGAHWGGNAGYGVSVSIVDTGLIPGAAARHAWLTGVRATGGPVHHRWWGQPGSRSVRRPRDIRRRRAALRGPESLGLRGGGVQQCGRRLRVEAPGQPGGRSRPRPGYPRVHVHVGHPPRSVSEDIRRVVREAHQPHQGPGRARSGG